MVIHNILLSCLFILQDRHIVQVLFSDLCVWKFQLLWE